MNKIHRAQYRKVGSLGHLQEGGGGGTGVGILHIY